VKLKLAREHYLKQVGNVWIPKKSFKSVDEIKEQTGFDPNKCLIYTCSFCNLLHMYSPDWKDRNVA